jgi:hypothetical protein
VSGSYQNKVTAKFDTFAGSVLVPRDPASPQFTVNLATGRDHGRAGRQSDHAERLRRGEDDERPDDRLAAAVRLHELGARAADARASGVSILAVNRATQAATVIASVLIDSQSAAVQFAQTTGIAHTVDTSTYAYYVTAHLNDQWGDGGGTIYNFTIGYTQNNYSQGM